MPNSDTSARLVFNPNLSEYLVIWQHEYTPVDQDVYACRIGSDGSPISNPIPVAQSSNSEIHPDAVFNMARQEYLLVYEYAFSDSDHDIYAQRLDATGNASGPVIQVAASGSFESMPMAAYQAQTNQYLVVWQVRQGGDEFTQNDIHARWLWADGTLALSEMVIADSVSDEALPCVAAGSDGACVAAWQARKDPSGDYGIYARRVQPGDKSGGDEWAVSVWEYDQVKPRLAFDSATNEYLLVWEDHHWGWGDDWDIYGCRVGLSGEPIGNPLAIDWQGSQHRLNPDVAFQLTTNHYLVTWEFEYGAADHDIFYCRLYGDGTPAGDVLGLAVQWMSCNDPTVSRCDRFWK